MNFMKGLTFFFLSLIKTDWKYYFYTIINNGLRVTFISDRSLEVGFYIILTCVKKYFHVNLSEYVWFCVKVSKSQNKSMKSSFFPKNEQNIARISTLTFKAEILAIFRSFIGKNDDFIHLF